MQLNSLLCSEIVQAAWLVGHEPDKGWRAHQRCYVKGLQSAVECIQGALNQQDPHSILIRETLQEHALPLAWLIGLENALESMARGETIDSRNAETIENVFRALSFKVTTLTPPSSFACVAP